jgi:hypothetical protein
MGEPTDSITRARIPFRPRIHAPEADVAPFDSQLETIAAAEAGDGWLAECMDRGLFLLRTSELIQSLAAFLTSLGQGGVLEVCAGNGELSQSLAGQGVAISASDVVSSGPSVVKASATEALLRYRPRIVVGSFVPIDSDVDYAVMSFPTVQHYVVLGARVGGLFGSPSLWQCDGWHGRAVNDVARWMVTRHDVWTANPSQPILQHGEAWHFQRIDL